MFAAWRMRLSARCGEVETASGHRFHALLGICVEDVCEHHGTSLLVPTDIGWSWLAGRKVFEGWVADGNRKVPAKPPRVLVGESL